MGILFSHLGVQPGVPVGVGVGVGLAVAVGVGVPPWQLFSQFPALTITFPQSPLCTASAPTWAVTPTVVWPPLTGRYATSDSPKPKLFWATSVAPEASVTMFARLLLRVATPDISGCPALWGPSVNALFSTFIE